MDLKEKPWPCALRHFPMSDKQDLMKQIPTWFFLHHLYPTLFGRSSEPHTRDSLNTKPTQVLPNPRQNLASERKLHQFSLYLSLIWNIKSFDPNLTPKKMMLAQHSIVKLDKFRLLLFVYVFSMQYG